MGAYFGSELPPSPENGGKKKKKGRESNRPYTDTYLIGLRMGLSCEELRVIEYPAILWLMHEYNSMNKIDEKESESSKQTGERMATEADIRALMYM